MTGRTQRVKGGKLSKNTYSFLEPCHTFWRTPKEYLRSSRIPGPQAGGGISLIQKELSSKFHQKISFAKEC